MLPMPDCLQAPESPGGAPPSTLPPSPSGTVTSDTPHQEGEGEGEGESSETGLEAAADTLVQRR